ncbi:MAG: glycosyltransferase [Nevskia sp.]|nr:glycosyltransferase [Nevskia sp.]
MSRPLFSVVIPTRERPETLAKALATCLAQDFDDYEIIVCDNAGGPETKAVVDAANTPRIVYLRAPAPLAMSANWELAVSAANGEYVSVLGDDDGLMPYALRELARIVASHDRPAAVHWRCGHYNWPTIKVAEEANYLAIPLSRAIEKRCGRTELLRAARFEIGYDRLPSIYTATIRRDIIEEHRARAGCVFGGLYPDVYSGFAFAYLCESFVTTSVPMHVAGLSARSNGVAALMEAGRSDASREFYSLQQDAGYARHPTVPDFELFPVHNDDSFQQAKARLFQDDAELSLDRRVMLTRYLAAIPDVGEEERQRIKGLIRASLADRPDLQAWFDTEALELPPCPPFRLKPARFGFDGQFLHLDTTRFGITDICGAVALADSILQVDPQGVRFDLRVLPEVVTELSEALIERSQALEATLEDLTQVRTALAERSQALEVTLEDLTQVRTALAERSQALEVTLEDLTQVRATLVERTRRLAAALK